MSDEAGERRLRASGALLSSLIGTYASTLAAWGKITSRDLPMTDAERESFMAELITIANGIHAIVEGERNGGNL